MLPNNYKDIIIDGMTEGRFIEELFPELGISFVDHDELIKNDKVYQQIVREGEVLCYAWWLNQGRRGMTNKEFQNSTYVSIMKNKFGWTDRKLGNPKKSLFTEEQ